MKFFKYLILSSFVFVLSACGGHGYEGDYKASTGEASVDLFMGMVGPTKMTIGSDYVEIKGKRTELADIFVRESSGKSYLVFKNKNDKEQAWEILDNGDLVTYNKGMKVTWVKEG